MDPGEGYGRGNNWVRETGPSLSIYDTRPPPQGAPGLPLLPLAVESQDTWKQPPAIPEQQATRLAHLPVSWSREGGTQGAHYGRWEEEGVAEGPREDAVERAGMRGSNYPEGETEAFMSAASPVEASFPLSPGPPPSPTTTSAASTITLSSTLSPSFTAFSDWTPRDDAGLVLLIKSYDYNDWAHIAAHFPGKSVEACRQRWGLVKVRPHREEREREESRGGMCVCAFFPFRAHPRTDVRKE